MKHISVTIVLIALLVLAAQCQLQPSNLSAESLEQADEKLKVVATTNIIGDLVANVGGTLIDLTVMMPPGTDVHTFTPTPGDAASVADAHIVFINGLNLEEFLERLIENAGGEARIVAVSTGVETHTLEREAPPHDHNVAEEEAGHNFDPSDPHIWMTPANAIVMVRNIEQALRELDPDNAKAYEANALVYTGQLEELDAWVKTQIERIPTANRQLVTDHDALGYYAKRYGLEIVGTVIPAYSTNVEPSAQELAALQDAIDEHQAKAIFVGVSVNPVLVKRISDDSGIRLVPLYTNSLGEPGSGVETYLDFIRYNTTAIVDALQ